MGLIGKHKEQSREEGACFQGALGAQVSREYLHREEEVDLLPFQQCP